MELWTVLLPPGSTNQADPISPSTREAQSALFYCLSDNQTELTGEESVQNHSSHHSSFMTQPAQTREMNLMTQFHSER